MPPPSFLHPQKRFDIFPIIQVSPAVMQVVGRGWSSAKSESVQIITGLPGQKPASELSDISHGGPQTLSYPQFRNYPGRGARDLSLPDTPRTDTTVTLWVA